MTRAIRCAIIGLALSWLSTLAAVEVPADLARVLAAADAAATPTEALRVLTGWSGAAHALHQARLGAALTQEQRWPAAEAAWRRALELDPTLHGAGLGLAECRLRQDDAAGALALCAVHLDRGTAASPELLLYAHAARAAGDSRLLAVLIADGIARFPAESAWRRLDIGQLADTARWGEAAQAARALLTRSPADVRLWQALAAAEQELGRDAAARVALEAAVLADDGRHDLRHRLADVQLAAGFAPAALANYRWLLNSPYRTSASSIEDRLMSASLRAAIECGEVDQARAWFADVPSDHRDPRLALALARLAVDLADRELMQVAPALTARRLPAAVTAVIAHARHIALAVSTLDALAGLGAVGADVLLWSGQLAERCRDAPRAEACYRRAVVASGAAAALAPLYLAQLLHRQSRRDEARQVLAEHLERHPADATARTFRDALVGAGP